MSLLWFVLGGCVWSGLLILVWAVWQAHRYQGMPLSQLGVRPKGRGVWEWWWNSTFSSKNTGVGGYDPILGSFAPILRIAFHGSIILMLGSIGCFVIVTTTTILGIHQESKVILLEIFVTATTMTTTTTLVYLSACYYVHHRWPGVSVPGGPRPHKIQRQPQWNTNDIPLLLQSSQSLMCQAGINDDTPLCTGEAAGRDVWMCSTTNSQSAASNTNKTQHRHISEAMIQEMAAGGRTYGIFNPSINPNSCDMPYRAQRIQEYASRGGTPPSPLPAYSESSSSSSSSQLSTRTQQATRTAVHFYSMLLSDDGHWGGDYGGPHFLLPGLIVAWYVLGKPTNFFGNDDESIIALMKHYILAHQQTDGGWGTHIESPSTMFGTTMMYVALRLLGADQDEPACIKGRDFLKTHGGVLYTSSWAKFYLCVLGCMHWDGHNSVPPEMWLLPNWFPFHPGRMWCHARMVYLPMGYLYGVRFVYENAETDPLILSLRKELYCEPYDAVPWIKTRHMVAAMDNYSPISIIMKTVQNILARYETWSIFQPLKNFVRRRGLAFCVEYMKAEDLQTNYIDIGPVNKVLNMISMYYVAQRNVEDIDVQKHLVRVADYLWLAEDGMKMKGYNGSQCWDTSFAIQAVHEAGLVDEFPDVAKKVWSYLERTQILSTEVSQATLAYPFESPEKRSIFYRHISKGGWPFSTSAHGWPIADCTGEGLKGVLCLLKSKTVKDGVGSGELRRIGDARLQDAINILLSYQNEDGGFATYENNRGFGWYESLNPSEVFGDIMIDYSYVELTMASLTALVDFHKEYPMHRRDEIVHALEKGREFLKSIQRDDGSWYGSWACCFCYGVWFGVEGLIACGEPLNSECITKACAFLLKHQRSNGGWGEDFTSCYDKDYAKDGMKAYGDDGSGVVNTAWALLALSVAQCPDVDAVKRGVQYLLKRQLPCGDWPQEGIAGVFNRACGITYTAYRNVFPIWALGRCSATYGAALDG